MGRLALKGCITDPVGNAKSVLFTEDGARESQRLLQALFRRQPDRDYRCSESTFGAPDETQIRSKNARRRAGSLTAL